METIETVETIVNEQPRKRNWFVTTYLWLSIIGNVFSMIINISTYRTLLRSLEEWKYLESDGSFNYQMAREVLVNDGFISLIVALLEGVLLILFYVLILRWKKVGFWCAIIAIWVANIANLILTNMIEQTMIGLGYPNEQNEYKYLIIAAVFSVILWAVLQIKKNGVSCWKNLK